MKDPGDAINAWLDRVGEEDGDFAQCAAFMAVCLIPGIMFFAVGAVIMYFNIHL